MSINTLLRVYLHPQGDNISEQNKGPFTEEYVKMKLRFADLQNNYGPQQLNYIPFDSKKTVLDCDRDDVIMCFCANAMFLGLPKNQVATQLYADNNIQRDIYGPAFFCLKKDLRVFDYFVYHIYDTQDLCRSIVTTERMSLREKQQIVGGRIQMYDLKDKYEMYGEQCKEEEEVCIFLENAFQSKCTLNKYASALTGQKLVGTVIFCSRRASDECWDFNENEACAYE